MQYLASYWQWAISAFALAADVAATVHVVLHKRDSRAAIGWAGVIWLTPLVGPLLYFLFGVNRIRRKARRLRRPLDDSPKSVGFPDLGAADDGPEPPPGAEHLDRKL